MPLPLPNLDNRRWADLVEESRALIPRYAPLWTDHNVHDPGITLIELFAWLAETDIYQLSQVPERHLRKFLALIGFTPRPPQPAQALLAFTPDPGTAPFLLPAGLVFEASWGDHEEIPFSTAYALTIVDNGFAAVQVDSGGGLRDVGRVFEAGRPFAPFGPDPRPGAALYLGLRQALPPGETTSLGLHFVGEKAALGERARLIDEALAQAEAYRRPCPGITCNGNGGGPLVPPEAELPAHHSARVVWEFYASAGGGKWVTLQPHSGEVVDDTRALTLNGTVRFTLPSAMMATKLGDVDEALFYIRCRLEAGHYDAAPRIARIRLNTVPAVQAASGWQRLTIAPGAAVSGPPPTLGQATRLTFSLDDTATITELAFAPDAPDCPDVTVLGFKPPVGATSGRLTLEMCILGIGSARPGQRMTLPEAPVQQSSVMLYTLEDTTGGKVWRVWQQREDLDASRRTDAHYILNETTGEIVFGDGERGRVPGAGVPLLVAYRATLAEEGNVSAATKMQPAETPSNELLLNLLPAGARAQLPRITTNWGAAAGGAAAEAVPHAIGRAVETLWAHERLQALCSRYTCQTLDQIPDKHVLAVTAPTRAVNTLDIERLALDVPGTQVRRARAWSNLHPGYPCQRAAGVVTVVVVPELPRQRPQPSQGLLGAVRCYLEWRRIVTTRIEVVGPSYVTVSVQAQVRRRTGVDSARLRAAIVKALNRFLDPLCGGPEGEGWPFGRDVYRSEILQVIDNVPGVDYVHALTLRGDRGKPSCGNLCVGPTWLVTPGEHQIEVT
jgi:hypothetical protein